MATHEEVLTSLDTLTEGMKGMSLKQCEALLLITKHLKHQAVRAEREAKGLGYLNREEDVVNRLKEQGL